MEENNDFEINEFCWAKIKGFPTWPSYILDKKNSKYKVQFIGDYNHSNLQKKKLFKWTQQNSENFSNSSKKYKELFNGAIYFKKLIDEGNLSISDYINCYQFCYQKEGKWNCKNIELFLSSIKGDNLVYNSINIDGKVTPTIFIKCQDDKESNSKGKEIDYTQFNKSDLDNVKKETESVSLNNNDNKDKNSNSNKSKKERNDKKKNDRKKNDDENKKKRENKNNKKNKKESKNESKSKSKSKINNFLGFKRLSVSKPSNISLGKKNIKRKKEDKKSLVEEFLRIGKILFNSSYP